MLFVQLFDSLLDFISDLLDFAVSGFVRQSPSAVWLLRGIVVGLHVGMVQHLLDCWSFVWIEAETPLQEIDQVLVVVVKELLEWLHMLLYV